MVEGRCSKRLRCESGGGCPPRHGTSLGDWSQSGRLKPAHVGALRVARFLAGGLQASVEMANTFINSDPNIGNGLDLRHGWQPSDPETWNEARPRLCAVGFL
jgi:hypothetical protein